MTTIFIVLATYPTEGEGYAGDPVYTLDDAADVIVETERLYGSMIPVRVLRIADSLNCDDVTACAFDLIAKRIEATGVAA